MSDRYTIKAGDNLSKIAREHGYPSWRLIYNHPSNADFRRLRPDPHRIQPGDIIVLPPKPGSAPQANLMLPWNFARMLQFSRPLRLVPVPLTELPTLGPTLVNPPRALSLNPRSTSVPALRPLTLCGPVADTPSAPVSGPVRGGYGTALKWTGKALLKCGPIKERVDAVKDAALDFAWRTAPPARRAGTVILGITAASVLLSIEPSREFIREKAHDANVLGVFGVDHVGLAPRLGINGDWGGVITFNLEHFFDDLR